MLCALVGPLAERCPGFLGGRRLIAFEPGTIHSALRLRILHKSLPYKTGAGIFRHYHGDSGIDSHHVAVVPILQRIECVNEAVVAPRPRFITVFDRPQHAHGGRGCEGQGTPRRARHDGAIDRSGGRRPAPDFITLVRIRRGDAPQVVAVVRKGLGQAETESPVHVGGDYRILKVVGVAIALAAKIKPRLGILVDE